MIKVLAVSDIRLYCEGLAEALERSDDVSVVGTAISFGEAVEILQREHPQVVVLDMTTNECMSVVRYIETHCIPAKIVSLAVQEMGHDLARCFEVGITCYVSRDASITDLLEAIKQANNNEFYCSQTLLASLFKTMNSIWNSKLESDLSLSPTKVLGLQGELTRRELQIAELLSSKLSNKQIARQLSIELCTVKNHVHNILVKLGVSNRSDVAVLLNKSE